MIRNVLMMATSGLVLFSQEFVNAVAQPRLMGSLLTTMVEFSGMAAGMPISYIELGNVSVTIVLHEAAKVFCALFHDRDDGPTFGRLICTEMLYRFIDRFSSEIGSPGHNLKDFHDFHREIADAIRNAVNPVLAKVQAQRGVILALLITEDAEVHPQTDVDKIGVLANLQPLLSSATDILAHQDDAAVHLALEGSSHSRILLWRIDRAVLVVSVSKQVSSSKYRAAIEEARDMLEKVVYLVSNLHLVTR